MTLIQNFIALFIESAPYLLLGMLLAGLLHELIPQSWLQSLLGGRFGILKAALIGAPLPLCSCSVIPVAMGIRRAGANKASTASFMVATPETGVDSIGITYALMGPVMAIVRPVVAVITAVITGAAIAAFTKDNAAVSPASNQPETTQPSCCKHECSPPEKTTNWQQKLLTGTGYGFGPLLKDFMWWLLIGLTFAAVVQTFVPTSLFSQFGDSVWAMLLVVLLSIPMYICATASTPIAVGLLMAGVSPGAALVFMLSGPATNIATLMVVRQELGKSALVCYLLSVIGCALGAGLLLDHAFAVFNWQLDLSLGQHSDLQGMVYFASALLLAALIGWQVFKQVRSLIFSASATSR